MCCTVLYRTVQHPSMTAWSLLDRDSQKHVILLHTAQMLTDSPAIPSCTGLMLKYVTIDVVLAQIDHMLVKDQHNKMQ